jgi:hypothetical protein
MWMGAFGFKFIHYPGICLKGVKKHTKYVSHDSSRTDRDLNPVLPQYEAECYLIDVITSFFFSWLLNKRQVF